MTGVRITAKGLEPRGWVVVMGGAKNTEQR